MTEMRVTLLSLFIVCTFNLSATAAAAMDPAGAGGHSAELAKDVSTEAIKEWIRGLYMNMDVPEIGPGDSIGTLNVSLKIGGILKLSNNQLDVAFTLDLRWRHKFLERLGDTMEGIPLSRQKLWTPQFVFVNVLSVSEDQSSLHLHLTGSGDTGRAVVYKIWHRASIRCDGPSIQYPFSDTLCALVFEDANPESQRSIHMSLGRAHQMNCSRSAEDRHSIVYRVAKPFSDTGRRFQFWTRICVRSSLDEMLPAVRLYGLTFIMVLLSLTTVYFFDRNTRLFINLALLHILIFNWAPAGQHLNAIDIWNAMCTFVICCCLLVALARRSERAAAAAAAAAAAEAAAALQEEQQLPRSAKHSYNGTLLYQKDPRSSKCTAISESSDHLDELFGTVGGVAQTDRRRRCHGDNRRPRQGGCHLLAMVVLPVWWALFVATFWAALLLTAATCERLLPECFQG